MRGWTYWYFVLACALGCGGSGDKERVVEPGEGEDKERVVEPGEGEDAERVVEVVVRAGEGSPAIALVSADGAAYPAIETISFSESGRPWKIVVLVQGQMWWMGNQLYTEVGPDLAAGAYPGVSQVLAMLDARAPSAARELVVYGDAVVHRPGESLVDALGAQQDYEDDIGRSLVAGLTKALLLLEGGDAERRILVYLGDGEGHRAGNTEEVAAAAEKLEAAGVEAFSIHYAARRQDDPTGATNAERIGYTHAVHVDTHETMSVYAEVILKIIDQTVVARFRIPATEGEGWKLRVGDEERPVDVSSS